MRKWVEEDEVVSKMSYKHYENVSPYLAIWKQWLRNRYSIKGNRSKIAYFPHSAAQAEHAVRPLSGYESLEGSQPRL